MTPIELPGGDLPDNLPLLTQVADEDTPDDLPTLTEVVAEGQAEPAAGLQPDADREVPAPEAAIPASCAPDGHGKGAALENETSHARFPHPNPLPLPSPQSSPASGRGGERERQSLIPAGEGANESLREFHVNEEEMQRLLRQIETHLENVFANKLSANLEQLQRQAVEQAVSELKAELPELLRNALNAHPEL